MLKKSMALLATVLVTGCGIGGYSISNIDKPGPELYEQWNKKGVSVLEVKEAMLECGYPNVFSGSLGGGFPDKVLNIYALAEQCMRNHGFVYSGRFGTTCEYKPTQYLPACQLNAVIPTRSVERRLNSPFCKKYPQADACTR